MKNYIIVGDNNFWYSKTGLVTEEQLQERIQEVKEYAKGNIYENEEKATELYVYEASETSLTINL